MWAHLYHMCAQHNSLTAKKGNASWRTSERKEPSTPFLQGVERGCLLAPTLTTTQHKHTHRSFGSFERDELRSCVISRHRSSEQVNVKFHDKVVVILGGKYSMGNTCCAKCSGMRPFIVLKNSNSFTGLARTLLKHLRLPKKV